MKCKHCEKEIDGTYGSGLYCSRGCSNARKHTQEAKARISAGLSRPRPSRRKEIPERNCIECGNLFTRSIRKGYRVVCLDCKINVKHHLDEDCSFWDLSLRTIGKIFERANIGCAICGWNESTCDLHHIIPKSEGINNNIDNLINVCPNHHRIIHSNKTYSREFLQTRSVAVILPNWKDYYNQNNKCVG